MDDSRSVQQPAAEPPANSGPSTHEHLSRRLRAGGLTSVTTQEYPGSLIGERISSLPSPFLDPLLSQLLFAARDLAMAQLTRSAAPFGDRYDILCAHCRYVQQSAANIDHADTCRAGRVFRTLAALTALSEQISKPTSTHSERSEPREAAPGGAEAVEQTRQDHASTTSQSMSIFRGDGCRVTREYGEPMADFVARVFEGVIPSPPVEDASLEYFPPLAKGGAR